MAGTREIEESGTLPRLDDRVLETLEGSHGRVAFSGLRRMLRVHPESLSRALHRLEREGLVERGDGGYRSLVAGPVAEVDAAAHCRAIARVELPPGTTPAAVAARLTGRWFGTLRWVGAFDRGRERLLLWARRDGAGTVYLGVEPTALRVYVREGEAGGDPAEAEEAAYELLYHAVQSIRPNGAGNGRGSAGVSYLVLGPEGRSPGPARDN
ncbi:MAG TPA: MarR family transcriptional regulator [Thermoplasmata archaeon]|nr:MarR family transcriptional regulator [Thermoplasmata archaeon]